MKICNIIKAVEKEVDMILTKIEDILLLLNHKIL
jgi:hypothetical protein